MLKAIFFAAIVSLALTVSPLWATTEGNPECRPEILAQNSHGHSGQYGNDHNQMHGEGGSGCGGGNQDMNHNMGNYRQNPNTGYRDQDPNPNYRYSNPNYRNDGMNHYQSGGGHHH